MSAALEIIAARIVEAIMPQENTEFPINRIVLMAGEWPNNERDRGGYHREAFAERIKEVLQAGDKITAEELQQVIKQFGEAQGLFQLQTELIRALVQSVKVARADFSGPGFKIVIRNPKAKA